jgi:DNA-binding SARP family transcriptional activator/pimeloyl-ACP methyl ester carboxylesterase
MRIRVLGPAEVDGGAVALERKPRELLTLLALRAPDAVGDDELATLLWDDPPATAVRTIQSHVSRVRVALARAGTDDVRVDRVGGGYALRAGPGTTDADVVRSLRAKARALAERGEADAAAGLLREARGHWRGPIGLPATVAAAAVATRWAQERRSLVDEHLAAVVAGSRPGDAVAELQAATAADPSDERRWTLLVRSLHRSGRPAAAVRAFQDARAALAEIGFEPGPELRRAEAEALGAAVTPASSTVEVPSLRDVRYARTDGVDVAHVTAGAGPPDLLLVNPGLVSIDGLVDEPRLLAAIGRLTSRARVLTFDRRGTGLSGRTGIATPTIDDWVNDAVAVLDAAAVGSAFVMGCSDSCLVALALAAAHAARVRGVVLVHGYARYVRGDGYLYGVDPATASAISDEVLAPEAPPGRFDPLSHIAPSVAADADFRRWWDALGRRAASPTAAAALHDVIRTADARHLLGAVAAPVLLLHRRSCASHSRHLAAHLPNARLVVLPGSDELWFTGDTGPLLDEVERFVAETS